jgi:hypothetical protein
MAESAPSVVTDEPSDGVIRQHITTSQTAPVKRGRLPSDPPDDDRPDDATGEITLPRARLTAEPKTNHEPSILVADLAAVHSMVSAHADDRVTARIGSDAATPSREAPVREARSDAVSFSEIEEAFFRAGHDSQDKEPVTPAPAPPETFEDLDEDYRPVGFWDRLRGKTATAPVPPQRSKK